MRILFVNEWLGYFGGVEQNVASTAVGLARRGHECHLAWGREARNSDVYASLFRGIMQSSEAGGSAGPGIADAAARLGADVVYFHKLPRLPDRMPPAGKVRTVRMIHDHDLCCPRRHKYFVHNQRICNDPAGWRCWLDLAFLAGDKSSPLRIRYNSLPAHMREMRRNHEIDQLLVGSRFMLDELLMNGFAPEKVAILPPVVPMEDLPAEPIGESRTILFVGQLIRGKGVDLLLHALARMNCEYDARIIGDGNARPALQALCTRLGLDERVRFLGWIPNVDLPEHYLAARLVVVPARWPEPFGMIGLEAMRHARPVVATRAGGIPDWLAVGVTGLLADEQDTAGLANAMTRLLDDRALATRMGEAGRARVQREFRFDDYLVRLEALLSGVPGELPATAAEVNG